MRPAGTGEPCLERTAPLRLRPGPASTALARSVLVDSPRASTRHTHPTLGVWERWTVPLEDEARWNHVMLPGPRWDQPCSPLRTMRQDVTFEGPEQDINHKTKGTIMTSSDA